METETKALSFKEILDKVAYDDYEQQYCTIKDFDALHRNYSWQDVKNCIDKAAELYKDSCLAAQKAELKGKIEAQLIELKQFSGGSLYKKGLKKAIEIIEKS